MDENIRGFSQQNTERLAAAAYAGEWLHMVLEIGHDMLRCGGEVSRVEDSIRRLCIAFGAEQTDVFTITSSIVVTIYAPAFGAVTQTRRVYGTAYDLHRLEEINQLCRQLCSRPYTLEQAREEWEKIRVTPVFAHGVQLVAWAVVSGAFSLFFGGSLLDAAASALVGVVLKSLDRLIHRLEANAFLSALLCSCLGGCLAMLMVALGFGHSADMISIGNIMLLIPGIALTNSLRDMFSGNTISGLMRFLEALLLALVIAFGFAVAPVLVPILM